MTRISITRAKARLSELVASAEAGETIEITRRGKVVARLLPPEPKRQWRRPDDGHLWHPVDIATLKALDQQMPTQSEPSGDFIRRMRDDARY